ncbi:hypothetical protein [Arthrobacter sp. M4]|uniref:hypothetical protein n=1 Tax=Arthrobacter sp. M4 TaxID=218160 RepID=UPI001CDC0070|nr:hypothetical protein [Arthrobacter sp. M4]MCA4134780.1 hypothetical protein [Arthrobacter sp. M4]
MAAGAMLALASCSGGGGTGSPSGTATTSATAQPKVYSEDELRALISGMTDKDGKELKLYSKGQVDQGGKIANLLMNTAKVDPQDCKSIATAGLLDSAENGQVAVAISESAKPRTLSAQSGSSGPDAVELLKGVKGKMGQCAKFTVEVVGQKYDVSSKELQAKTKGDETFATSSTRGTDTSNMLMQVSGAKGRLLVVATKGGSGLANSDQKELEELVNKVFDKAASGSTGTATGTTTSSPTATSTSTSTSTGTSTSSGSSTSTSTSTSTATSSPSSSR